MQKMTPSVTCKKFPSKHLPRWKLKSSIVTFHQALEAGLAAWRRLSEARGPVLRRGSVLQAAQRSLSHENRKDILVDYQIDKKVFTSRKRTYQKK